jgi:hypothetical protein
MNLPTEKRKPIGDLSQEIILGYGIPKIGKSTFFSHFPNALFLSTEEGLNHLEVFEHTIRKWMDFVDAVRELEKNPTQYQTVVIDTIDNLYLYCQTYMYDLHHIKHESDLEWGKGWAQISSEFRRQVTRLSQIKSMGLCFVSHSEEKETRRPGHAEAEVKICHTLPARARKVILPMADMVFYMEVDNNGQRVIRTKPSNEYEAGDRSGKLPATLPLNFEDVVNAYYSDNGDAQPQLIAQIKKGLTILADKKIDNFDTEKRVANSMTKHLGTTKLKDDKLTLAVLQSYLQHLRAKARVGILNGGKNNADVS